MKRLFVSIELRESVTQTLSQLDPQIRGVRWLEPRQMHLTLAFLGNVSAETQ
jgi:2'-5' RNA ligase